MNNFHCNICNKSYKNKSGKWKHDKKYHYNLSPNSANFPPKFRQIPPNSANLHQNNTTNLQSNLQSNLLECKYCNNTFTRKDSLVKHYNRCKIKKENTDEFKKENIEELKEAIKKDIINDIMKNCKIHPKTLQKINKQLINNTNNGIINNINIVKFGSENIKDILNEKEIINILNQHYSAIEESIKTVHFNDQKPEYKNIYITNLRDNLAYIYNGNNYEAVQKTSVINKLIDDHVYNIEVSLENYKHKLSEKSAKVLEKLIEKINDEQTKINDYNHEKEYKNFKAFKINEIKLLIYNESKNAEVIRLKYNN
jgi:hypothetical protein